ncbi:T9SS type B sorting domain-containing protein [Flavobacterium sp. 3HN19-14]|uniref:T9SS type B sorting domain-containing protein n=1 Tax=Flavobacterium sp. 3HN19-14 TaxID=3448133 RepID=UPI003EE1AD56
MQQDLDASDLPNFICKFSPGGTENWIVELPDYLVRDFKADASDNLYFLAGYFNPPAVQFGNTSVSNLPVLDNQELALFKIDVNRNFIWNFPIYGLGTQQAYNLAINNFGEILIPVQSKRNTTLHYASQSNTIATGNNLVTLFKVKPDGNLTDFKRLYENTTSGDVSPYGICADSGGDIILGGFIRSPTDFDPSLYDEHTVIPSTYLYPVEGIETTFYESIGFILKLENCDTQQLYGNQYDLCADEFPNPTIGDIKLAGSNVVWYASSVATTKLNANFPLVDGQTYYYENPVENCSDAGRFPLQINILPPSPLPVIANIQPCYFQSMRLSDVNISGQSLIFYTADTNEIIPAATFIVPGTTYYVSQTVGFCESAKIPLTLFDNPGSAITEYSIGFCDDGSNRSIDLSDYNVHFLPNGASQSDYMFAYFHSDADANANVNPITNFQNYPVNQQTVYIRIFSSQSSCFRIVNLKLELFSPPVIDEVQIVDLAENNSITILPFDANYTYSLDGITFQTENYFENLTAGEYKLYIKNGDCPGAPKAVYVLAYPKFFTPNGDGTNDSWKVKYSQLQVSFSIEIYDRYGKVITVLDKTSAGWDGTYQGHKLPADDYWFRIIRLTNKEIIYRGHFALKR